MGNVVDVEFCFISENALITRHLTNPQEIMLEVLLSFSLGKPETYDSILCNRQLVPPRLTCLRARIRAGSEMLGKRNINKWILLSVLPNDSKALLLDQGQR